MLKYVTDWTLFKKRQLKDINIIHNGTITGIYHREDYLFSLGGESKNQTIALWSVNRSSDHEYKLIKTVKTRDYGNLFQYKYTNKYNKYRTLLCHVIC